MMSKTIIYHYNIEIFTGNAYLFQKSHNVNNLCTAPKQSRPAGSTAHIGRMRAGAPPYSSSLLIHVCALNHSKLHVAIYRYLLSGG